jgi:hypothetical protein
MVAAVLGAQRVVFDAKPLDGLPEHAEHDRNVELFGDCPSRGEG